jgi:Major Facilitator Superfamily
MDFSSKESKELTVAEEHSLPVDNRADSGPYPDPQSSTIVSKLYIAVSILLLFLNFFLAQYDKFVLSYFQANVIRSLHLSSNDYGILSGYATGIVYALLAIPVAFVADYTESRIWVLSVAALLWSLCVLFQGLSHNFWQILLARIGMGIGQAPVEALSISIISDLVEPRWLFLSERCSFQRTATNLVLTTQQPLLRVRLRGRSSQWTDRHRIRQDRHTVEQGSESHRHRRDGRGCRDPPRDARARATGPYHPTRPSNRSSPYSDDRIPHQKKEPESRAREDAIPSLALPRNAPKVLLAPDPLIRRAPILRQRLRLVHARVPNLHLPV